jgi:hypothetical protein
MSQPGHIRRLPFPVPELNDYLIDECGSIWHKGGHRNGRDRRLSSMSFPKAMQCLGERVGIAQIPSQVIPGIWKMRFAGTIEGSPYLGGKSLSDFFRRHAFGPNRVHPKWWPTWSPRTNEVATSIDDDQAPVWTVLLHLKHDSDTWRNIVQSADVPELHSASHQVSPVVVLGPLAKISTFGESSF